MIRNIVFDFGQVLVHFDPAYMTAPYTEDLTDPGEVQLLEDVVFDRLYWDRLDAGTITDEEVKAACKSRLPAHLRDRVDPIYDHWTDHIPPVSGMDELLGDLCKRGDVRLYLLSNISRHFVERQADFPVLRHFDACVFSAVCGMTKPHREIFDYLCRTQGLNPAETLFVDDSPINIRGARDSGWEGYLFDGDVPKLRAALHAILKK